MESSIIIIWLTEIFLIIPIQIIMALIMYDGLFQKGISPYNRMGAVLKNYDKQIFEKTRKNQIDVFKQFSIVMITLQILFFLIVVSLVILEIDRYGTLLIKITGIFSVIIVAIIIYSIGSEYLKPRDLRSMIAVVESKAYTRDLVQDQISSLSRSELIRNIDYHILVRSFFKKYYSDYSSYHDIPYVNYSIFKKEKNGTFDEKKIPGLLENDRWAVNYLTLTVLHDLKRTPLWHNDKKKEFVMYLGLGLQILAMGFLFSIDESNSQLFVFAFVMIFIPFPMYWLPSRDLLILTPKKVEQILTENDIEFTSVTRFDKIVELIETKYPYINL